MRLPRPKFQLTLLFLSLAAVYGVSLRAQEKPNSPDRSAAASAKPFPAAKSQPPTAEPPEADKQSPSGIQGEREESADQIRKRAEWFYRQRSSVGGHIPAGARLKAFQH